MAQSLAQMYSRYAIPLCCMQSYADYAPGLGFSGGRLYFMTKLSGRIRKARVASGMSQRELARRLGVTRGAVANWECSQPSAPTSERLQHLAHATGVAFEWLATGRGVAAHQSSPDHIPAADMEYVEDPMELRLLRCFRAAPQRHHHRIVASLEARYIAAGESTGNGAKSRVLSNAVRDGVHR